MEDGSRSSHLGLPHSEALTLKSESGRRWHKWSNDVDDAMQMDRARLVRRNAFDVQ